MSLRWTCGVTIVFFTAAVALSMLPRHILWLIAGGVWSGCAVLVLLATPGYLWRRHRTAAVRAALPRDGFGLRPDNTTLAPWAAAHRNGAPLTWLTAYHAANNGFGHLVSPLRDIDWHDPETGWRQWQTLDLPDAEHTAWLTALTRTGLTPDTWTAFVADAPTWRQVPRGHLWYTSGYTATEAAHLSSNPVAAHAILTMAALSA